MGTVIGVIVIALVALAAVALVLWPLVQRPEDEVAPDPAADARRAIEEDLQRSLEAVREIDMDHKAGNLSDEDFAALDAAERRRALDLMRRADRLEAQG